MGLSSPPLLCCSSHISSEKWCAAFFSRIYTLSFPPFSLTVSYPLSSPSRDGVSLALSLSLSPIHPRIFLLLPFVASLRHSDGVRYTHQPRLVYLRNPDAIIALCPISSARIAQKCAATTTPNEKKPPKKRKPEDFCDRSKHTVSIGDPSVPEHFLARFCLAQN